MKRRQFLYGGLAAAAVATTGYIVARRTDPDAEGAVVPAQPVNDASASTPAVWRQGEVPDGLWALHLPDLNNIPQEMAQWRGRRVVVNFWATWCAPCVKEMPDLDALARRHPDVQFVGIGIDSAANIRAFLEKVSVDYTLLVMPGGGIDLMRRLGNSQGGLPFTLVLDANGAIQHSILGQIDPAHLNNLLSA